MMVPRSKRFNYYYDCQCRSHGNGRLILETEKVPAMRN